MYPPWSDADLAVLRAVSPIAQDFCDPDGLPALAAKQKSHFQGWMRPHELCELPKMVHLISSFTIKQVNWKILCTAGCKFFLGPVKFLLRCKKFSHSGTKYTGLQGVKFVVLSSRSHKIEQFMIDALFLSFIFTLNPIPHISLTAQSIIGDCSFVASLAICADYERKFKTRLVTR